MGKVDCAWNLRTSTRPKMEPAKLVRVEPNTMPTVVTLRLPNTARVRWKQRWKKDVYPSVLKRIRPRSSTIHPVYSLDLAEPRWITVFWLLDTVRKRVRNSGKSRTRG